MSTGEARTKIYRGGNYSLQNWIGHWGDDLRVLAWEAANPPPPDWEGPPHSYAFCHMPKPDIGVRKIR
jgi:hypothetical protein